MNIASLIKIAKANFSHTRSSAFYTRKMCLQLRRFGGNVPRACARHQRGGDGLGRVGMWVYGEREGLRTSVQRVLYILS